MKKAKPEVHKSACAKCPSTHWSMDDETKDILNLPHTERVKTAFPCAWSPIKFCKGYCEQMGITDKDLLGEFKPDERALALMDRLVKYYKDTPDDMANWEAKQYLKEFNRWCADRGYLLEEINEAKRKFNPVNMA